MFLMKSGFKSEMLVITPSDIAAKTEATLLANHRAAWGHNRALMPKNQKLVIHPHRAIYIRKQLQSCRQSETN